MKIPKLIGCIVTNIIELKLLLFVSDKRNNTNNIKALGWNDLKKETPEDLKRALQRCQRKLLSPNPSNIKAEIKKMKKELELA